MKNKGKLSPITFLYGFGAAIVLIGAMFKFLGWSYANELFVVGLSIEALVFLVSAFERETDDKEYHWENVFPQLDGENGESPVKGYAEAMNAFGKSMTNITEEMTAMSKSVQEMHSGLKKMQRLSQQMDELSTEVNAYNQHLKELNARFQEFKK